MIAKLVPLDGSSLAEEILLRVKEPARLTGVEISLLRVALVHTFPGADPTDRQVEATQKAQGYLEKIANQQKKKG